MSKIFISYRRDDSKYQARMIFDALGKVLPPQNLFMDIDSIPPGRDFVEVLEGWVNECEIMLALIGPGWLASTDPESGKRRLDNENDFVRIEIRKALSRGIPVVPILIDGATMPNSDRLPDDLRKLSRRQAEHVEFRTFGNDVERLVNKLHLDAAAAPDPTDRGPAKPSNTPTQPPTKQVQNNPKTSGNTRQRWFSPADATADMAGPLSRYVRIALVVVGCANLILPPVPFLNHGLTVRSIVTDPLIWAWAGGLLVLYGATVLTGLGLFRSSKHELKAGLSISTLGLFNAIMAWFLIAQPGVIDPPIGFLLFPWASGAFAYLPALIFFWRERQTRKRQAEARPLVR